MSLYNSFNGTTENFIRKTLELTLSNEFVIVGGTRPAEFSNTTVDKAVIATAATNNVTDYEILMEPWSYTAAAVVLFFIGFFGFFLNLFVIILMCKDIQYSRNRRQQMSRAEKALRQLWTPMNIILFNLVCSDFSVSVLGNPFTLSAAIAHRWIFGRTLCVAYGFFMALLGITSITTLTVLSYERFCLVSCPFTTHQLSNRGAILSVVLIWCYSLALTTPPLFGWGDYVNEAANISCSVNWESQTINAATYIIFLFIMGLVIPVIVILYSYINIILTMRRNSARLGRVNRAERHVTWMVGVMIIAFIVAWTPYAIFALIEQFGPSSLISPGMAVLPALIAKSSICYNPLIYVGMNTQFRAALKRVRGQDTIGETTMNPITKTISKISIECTTPFDRRKKNKLKTNRKIQTTTTYNNQINEQEFPKQAQEQEENDQQSEKELIKTLQLTKCNKIINELKERQENLKKVKEDNYLLKNNSNYELSVISSGKSILIKTNSYKTNLC